MTRFAITVASTCLVFSVVTAREATGQDTPVFGPPQEMAFERVLREALLQPVTMHFEEAPLHAFATEFERQTRIPVEIDARALADAGLDLETPVTIQCDGVAARQVLDRVLHDLDLSWSARGRLVITTKEKVDEQMIIRVYPVADLIAADRSGAYAPDDNFGPLIDLISTTVQADTWNVVGGRGSIGPSDVAASLVISQTREVHEEVEDLLHALRAARHAQGRSPLGPTDLVRHQDPRSDDVRRRREPPTSAFIERPTSMPTAPVAMQAWQQPRRHE